MRKTKVCKHGTFTYYDNDFWIGGALENTGEYSPQEVDKLLTLITDESVVVEVGSNIGTITVPLAKKAKCVCAFEPQPQTFELLKENITQNNLLSKVVICDAAVGKEEGSIAIGHIDFDYDKINSGAASLLPERADGYDQHSVKLIKLDDYCKTWQRLDIIKADVEGSELDVIKGAEQTILRLKPYLYLENDRPEKSVDLIHTIMELGYILFWHFPEIYNPDPMRVQVNTGFVSANMLCIPSDKIYDVSLVSDLVRVMSEHDDWRLAQQRQAEAKERLGLGPKKPAVIRPNSWACIVRLGGVGDNLIASCVLPYVKKKYGHLEVITSEPQHVVFENNPHIDKLTVKAQGDPNWGNGQEWQDYWAQRAKEYAFFVNLSHSVESSRALLKVQTWYYWPASARRKMCGGNYLEAAADAAEVPYDEIAPGFFPTEQEVKQGLETKRLVGGKYIAWVLSGTRIDKLWVPTPVVIARILKETDWPIVLIGAPGKDFELAKLIQDHVKQVNGSDRNLHLALSVHADAPNWPIRRVLTQTVLADIVVSPDTGPAWAAAMMPMPKIVLLSHASPENITKHWVNTTSLHANPSRVPCWPCHLLIDEQKDCDRLSGRVGIPGAACIADIPHDAVVSAIKREINLISTSTTMPLLRAAE